MSVKTLPLNADMLGGQAPIEFFGRTLLVRQPPGKFYVIGRPYISQITPAGTLVVFHYQGQVVAHARLQRDWYRLNDDPTRRPLPVAIYLLERMHVLPAPCSVDDLPTTWQAAWPNGRFDQYPRTLDDGSEAEFLRRAAA
jgi:hypothetical protein